MKIIWYRLPLALKIALPMALLSLLSALTIAVIAHYGQQRSLHERTDKLGSALVARLAASAARPLVQNDALSLQAALAGFADEPAIQRAVVFDLKQQLVAAAGDPDPNSHDYSATIHWQDSAIGQAVLSLRPSTTRDDYPQLGDLVLLSMILAALSAICGLGLGNRAEAVLSVLTRKLSGEQIDFTYRGTDILARVLDVPPPPVLIAEPAATDKATIVMQLQIPGVMQVQIPGAIQPQPPNADDVARQHAFTLAEAIGNVYGGKVAVTRADGITLRFPIGDDVEGPFRAICCARLLQLLGKAQHFRIALTVMTDEEADSTWRTQALIERLQGACTQAPTDTVLIDNQLRRHPTIGERCVLENVLENSGEPENARITENSTAENNSAEHGMSIEYKRGNTGGFWQVVALKSPYDVLLERQFATLQEQIAT